MNEQTLFKSSKFKQRPKAIKLVEKQKKNICI